jgi:hypothetical protein
MSDPQNLVPQGSAGPISRKPKSGAAVLMIVVGIVLTLPGLCSLFFVTSFAISEPKNLLKFDDWITRSLWVLWSICFVVAIGGALLLRLGWGR